MSTPFEDPVWRWEPWRDPAVVLHHDLSRVVNGDDDDPEFVRRAVGFTADLVTSKAKRKRKTKRGKS